MHSCIHFSSTEAIFIQYILNNEHFTILFATTYLLVITAVALAWACYVSIILQQCCKAGIDFLAIFDQVFGTQCGGDSPCTFQKRATCKDRGATRQKPGSLQHIMELSCHCSSWPVIQWLLYEEEKYGLLCLSHCWFGIFFAYESVMYSSANVDPVQNCNLGHLQKREILISRQRK